MRIGTTEVRSGPEVDPAAWIDAAVEAFDVRSDILRQGTDATNRPLVQARNVDVEESSLGRLVGQDLFDDPSRQFRAACKIELRFDVFQRDGDAGAVKKGAFDRRRHGAGIKHVDSRVGAGVQTADHQVGRLPKKLEQGQL